MNVEEWGRDLPPRVIRLPEPLEPSAAVFGVTRDEEQAGLWLGKGRCANIDAEHGSKPCVFAHALVDHVLVNATPTRIVLLRAHGEIVVAELAPYAENLQALGVKARGRNLCTIRLWTTARAMGNALNEILERQRVPPLNYVSGGHADDPLGVPG